MLCRVILRVVPGLAQAGDLAPHSKPRSALPESAVGPRGSGAAAAPVRGGGTLILARVLGPSVLDPQACAAACHGAFLQGPGVWGRASALPTAGFRTSPGQLALILSRPGPGSCSCRLFFSPCCCGFCILESFCFGFSGASGQSELDRVFSLPFYRGSRNSLDNAPNP